jgi:hypothetical protein
MAEIIVQDHGSLIAFKLVHDSALEWVQENVDVPAYMWIGANEFVCEHRFAESVAYGLTEDAGFTLMWD